MMKKEVQLFDDGPFYRIVNGTQGNDTLNGFTDPANTPVVGYRPFDSHFPQDELFHGRAGGDHIFGRNGMDIIYGGNGKDILNGGVDDDRLYGGGSSDFLADPDVAEMYGQNGNDVLRLTVADIYRPGTDFIPHGGHMTGGMGADQFRVRALGVTDMDDVNYVGPGGTVTIHDFHSGQGDKILFQAKLAGGGALSGQAVFDLLDTNDDQKLNEHDGSTAVGRVTWDGNSEPDSDTGEVFFGSLHLRLGEAELEVQHTEQLNHADFLFG